MRLAFDVRAEWRQLMGHFGSQQLSNHWLAGELRQTWCAVQTIAAGIWRGIDVRRAALGARRRLLWVSPRVNPSHVRKLCGIVLVGLIVASASRTWRDTWSATAAVPAPPLSADASAADHGSQTPPLTSRQRDRQSPPRPPPVLSPADELALRKAALVQAQQKCLARLAGTEPYESTKARFDDLDARVQTLRNDDPYRELPRISVDWIEAKSDLQKIVDEAMKADPEVVRAAAAIKQPRRLR
jgi:hypothetical protein